MDIEVSERPESLAVQSLVQDAAFNVGPIRVVEHLGGGVGKHGRFGVYRVLAEQALRNGLIAHDSIIALCQRSPAPAGPLAPCCGDRAV